METSVTLTFPLAGDRFQVDRSRPSSRQAIPLRARVDGSRRVTFLVDGRAVAEVGAPFEALWSPTPGTHRIIARAGDAETESVAIVVR